MAVRPYGRLRRRLSRANKSGASAGIHQLLIRKQFCGQGPLVYALGERQVMSIATAFEAPACEDLIARGHALVPDFADRAARCESDCRLSEEIVERFRKTDLHKTLLPAAYGGYEMGFSALLETSFSIGKVCASSAWVCGLYMVHNWLGGLFPKDAQNELWGQDPGTFISGSYAPIGKATSVEGGYLLSGRFPFSSGSPGAAWNLCGAMLPIGPSFSSEFGRETGRVRVHACEQLALAVQQGYAPSAI